MMDRISDRDRALRLLAALFGLTVEQLRKEFSAANIDADLETIMAEFQELAVEGWTDGYEAGIDVEAMRRDHPEEYHRQAQDVKGILMKAVDDWKRRRLGVN
jgi:hypothetical protein